MADIVIVTANPAIDVTYEVAVDRHGETNRVSTVRRRPGGKGVNVAQVLAALGVETVTVVPLGGAEGAWLGERLEGMPGRLHTVPIAGSTRSTLAIVERVGHPTNYNERGPTLSSDEWADVAAAVRVELDGRRMLVIAGSLPGAVPDGILPGWIADAHERGVVVVVDCSGPTLLEAARAGADIVKVNEQELLDATGATTVARGMATLIDLGARLIVVSLGARGLIARGGKATHRIPAIEGVTGNPTGAGDAATAGLAAALLEGLSTREALAWASAAGAAAVLRPVAGEIDVPSFRRFVYELSARAVAS